MSLLRRRTLMEGSDEEVKEWKMLRNFVLDEDTRTVTISKDDSGAPFSISDFILQVNGTCDATSGQNSGVIVGEVNFPNLMTVKKDGTDISSDNFWSCVYNVGKIVLGANGTGAYGSVINNGIRQSSRLLLSAEPITSITAQIASATYKYRAGTQFVLYGR